MNIRNPEGTERVPDADVIHRCPVMDCTDFRRHHLAYVDDTLPGDVLVAAERHRVECAACGAHDTLVRRSLLLARNLPSIEPSSDFAARLDARLCAVRAEGRPCGAELDWSADGWSGARWHEARWYEARWYDRLRQDAGGWGRQAVAAAVVLAAVSAGYALRGGREAVSIATPAGVPATAAPDAVGAQGSGTQALGGAEVATAPAAGAARAGATRAAAAWGARGVRRHDDARVVAGTSVAPNDSDDLRPPAYIPLPTGALEAGVLLGPASAGIPVWPAALLAGEAPMQFRAAGRGGPSLRVVGLSH
ncbi:MAG TPA: hypothetical protein VGD56_09355 [Gemmatirosa sp.]